MMEKYHFLGKRKYLWFIVSLIIMLPGIVSLFVWKLPLGIDFKGGAQIEMKFEKTISTDELRQKLSGYPGVSGLSVSSNQGGTYDIRMLQITDDQHQQILQQLNKDFGSVTEESYQLVGASVSKDLARKAIIAVVLASIMIILYLAYSFRTVTHPVSSWRFGVTAVVALLHDLLITAGAFSILAHFLHWEVDASFITALLTVMGFSVHDSIVVFDRIRENLINYKSAVEHNFERIADESLSQTLNRSLATSLTVIFTLVALTVLGGASIRPFVATLLAGITIGTYSSIFTASPLLAVWQERAMRANTKED